jgi:hypothetical protein
LYVSGDVFKFTEATHKSLPAPTELNHIDAGALSVLDDPDETDTHEPDAFVQLPASELTLLLAKPPQPSVSVDTAPVDADVNASADGIIEPDAFVKPIKDTLNTVVVVEAAAVVTLDTLDTLVSTTLVTFVGTSASTVTLPDVVFIVTFTSEYEVTLTSEYEVTLTVV